MTTTECLEKMLASNPELYERILDTAGFAYYFNCLVNIALDGEKDKP